MKKFDEKRFVFYETFTNTNGKSSGSGFIGVIIGLIAAISFIAAMTGYFFKLPNTVEVMGEILKLVAASALLLGVRKVAGKIGNGTNYDDENEDEDDENKHNRSRYNKTNTNISDGKYSADDVVENSIK
jgi:hypothetical protein